MKTKQKQPKLYSEEDILTMIKEAIIPPVNSQFKVRISEVISPSKFWVQKCDQSEELDLLEEGLR